ncbi:MAG: DegV family protein [Eubacteriales bacterium]
MKKIKFVVDSSGDFSNEVINEYDLEVLPLGIIHEGRLYQDRVDISIEEFNKILETSPKIPTSVAVNIQEWYDSFERHAISGSYDMLIVVCLGHMLSCTLQNAIQAREMLLSNYPDTKLEIKIFNSNITTSAYSYPVIEAAKMYQASSSDAVYEEIETYLVDWFNHVEAYYVAMSMDLPRKSGRINTSSAFVGSLLNIKPILRVKEGKFTLVNKARGEKQVLKQLGKYVEERKQDNSPVFCTNGNHPTILTLLKEAYPEIEYVVEAGPAMTLNAGTDMFAFGFLSNEKHEVKNPL